MTARLEYLQAKGLLDPSQKYPERYYPVEHGANILRILVLKFLMKVNDSLNPREAIPQQESLYLMQKVNHQLEELRQIEKTILEQVAEELHAG